MQTSVPASPALLVAAAAFIAAELAAWHFLPAMPLPTAIVAAGFLGPLMLLRGAMWQWGAAVLVWSLLFVVVARRRPEARYASGFLIASLWIPAGLFGFLAMQ